MTQDNNPSHLTHPKYRPDIDGLRAIAVLSVVAYHAFPNWFKGGFIGVDIFFVISGFLISTILFESLDSDRFSFREFYERRINRIYPALIIVMIFCYGVGWFALLSDEFMQLGKHIAAGAGFVSNIILWSEAGYFDNSADLKPLLHLWSLGVEEQFYILWPFLLWALWRTNLNLLTFTLLFATASFLLNLYGVESDATATFYSPQTRFWELLSGSLLAWINLYKSHHALAFSRKINTLLSLVIYRKNRADAHTLANIAAFVGLALLLIGFLKIDTGDKFPGKLALLPVIGSVLIIAAGSKSWINKNILSNFGLVWFGLISYPLYLWHWPLLSFARIMTDGVPSRTIRIAAVIISIILAWLTYRFIERPLRNVISQKKVIILFFTMIFIGSIGFITYYKEGLHFRSSVKNITTVANLFSTPYPKMSFYSCNKYLPEFINDDKSYNGCVLSKDSPPSIAIIGDSHALQYRSALSEKANNLSVMVIAAPSCLPFVGGTLFNDVCKTQYQKMIDAFSKENSIKTVILSGYWSYLMSGSFDTNISSLTKDNWRIASTLPSNGTKLFEDNAERVLSVLTASGRDVILMKDIPDLEFNIKNCFDYRPLKISGTSIIKDCSIEQSRFVQRMKPYDDVIDGILKKYPSVKAYDPRPLFCTNGRCVGTDGKLPYYFNGDHLNHYGAGIVIDDLVNKTGIQIQ
ncbi:acyltransferase family protein [Aeromonas salmonicida]|uniref:acyltransferase family protein n=1 Tax=Aeromonas salmonicida TaxID=645 RepID=UPI003D202721